LEAGVVCRKSSSAKLLEKFGAKQEGLKRKSRICKADGKIKDELIYGLLKEDYLSEILLHTILRQAIQKYCL
jgi:RimJ/RimL family protein N-acetyltransferase